MLLTIGTISEPLIDPTVMASYHRIDPTDPDLNMILGAACASVRSEIGALEPAQYTVTMDAFPKANHLLLPACAVSTATISYTLQDGTVTEMDPSLYRLAPGRPFSIALVNGGWPGDALMPKGGVTITMQAGWTAVSLPQQILMAIGLEFGHLYEHRESVIASAVSYPGATTLPRGVEFLISPFSTAYTLALEQPFRGC